MKKALRIVLSAVLILSLGTASVFAASPQGGTSVNPGGSSVPANTNLQVVSASSGDRDIAEAKRQKLGIAGSLVAVYDIKLLDAAGKPVAATAGTTVRIDVSGLTTSDKVTIVHVKDDGTATKVAGISHNGYVTFKPGSFSIFGVIVEKGKGSASGNTTATSPQTGVYL